MLPSLLDVSDTAEAFASTVFEFAAAQDVDSIAKLIAFFHLAKLDGKTKVDFQLAASGRVTLQIEVDSEHG